MEEESNSWIMRTKFSHTICHRLDTSRLPSRPFTIQPDQNSGLKSRPGSISLDPKPEPKPIQKPTQVVSTIQQNPITNRKRAESPTPTIKISETFKEARSVQRRFSTPHPRKTGKKLSPKNSKKSRTPESKSPLEVSPLRQFSSLKFHEKAKGRKESTWTKYFDNGGGRVTSVETPDEYMVDLSKLFLGLRFAHGAHSQLYHGIYKDETVAVKIIRVPDDDETGVLGVQLENQFNREVTLLSRLHHQNVIKFVAACRKPPVFCVITEYLSEGSLRGHLHKLEHKSLPLEKVLKLALDIAKGMEFIHSEGVIHRDLKPENILINQDFQLKIADFGIACEEAYRDPLVDDPGTFRWMAPEMFNQKPYGRKVDVYGFGLILWELIAGSIPYEDMTPVQVAFAVANKNLRPAFPVDCPPPMKSLIEQCWSLQPEKRPEFSQIVMVLEQFQTSFASDGTLHMIPILTSQDNKKGLRHKKHNPNYSSTPKPKFS